MFSQTENPLITDAFSNVNELIEAFKTDTVPNKKVNTNEIGAFVEHVENVSHYPLEYFGGARITHLITSPFFFDIKPVEDENTLYTKSVALFLRRLLRFRIEEDAKKCLIPKLEEILPQILSTDVNGTKLDGISPTTFADSRRSEFLDKNILTSDKKLEEMLFSRFPRTEGDILKIFGDINSGFYKKLVERRFISKQELGKVVKKAKKMDLESIGKNLINMTFYYPEDLGACVKNFGFPIGEESIDFMIGIKSKRIESDLAKSYFRTGKVLMPTDAEVKAYSDPDEKKLTQSAIRELYLGYKKGQLTSDEDLIEYAKSHHPNTFDMVSSDNRRVKDFKSEKIPDLFLGTDGIDKAGAMIITFTEQVYQRTKRVLSQRDDLVLYKATEISKGSDRTKFETSSFCVSTKGIQTPLCAEIMVVRFEDYLVNLFGEGKKLGHIQYKNQEKNKFRKRMARVTNRNPYLRDMVEAGAYNTGTYYADIIRAY